MPRLDRPALEAAFQLIRSRKFAPLMPNGSTITGRSQDRPSAFPCWSAIGPLDKFGASKESEYTSIVASVFYQSWRGRSHACLARSKPVLGPAPDPISDLSKFASPKTKEKRCNDKTDLRFGHQTHDQRYQDPTQNLFNLRRLLPRIGQRCMVDRDGSVL